MTVRSLYPEFDNFVIIRPATAADLAAIVDLERSCPPAAHWSEGRYRELFHPAGKAPERLALIADDEPRSPAIPASREESRASISGFLVARPVASEWELENIAVAPGHRRQGVGRQLLSALFDRARAAGGSSVFLEVRESNAAARSLYEKAGFSSKGRRRSYYREPTEDAILYRKTLS